MIINVFCVFLGLLAGAGGIFWYLNGTVWPVRADALRREVEEQVRIATREECSQEVQPVVQEVIRQIQEVVNIVEEAVIVLMGQFQEITDAAIQEAHATATQLQSSAGTVGR